MQANSRLKNVVIVNDFNYTQGGATKVAIDTANLLVENNNEIKVYFFSAGLDKPDTLDKRIINISTNQGEALKDKNKIRGFINGIYNLKAKKEFKKMLKSLNRNETIIHVHGWTKCLSSSVFDIAFKMKFKIVLTLHDYFTACPNGGYFNYKQNKICKLKPLSMKCIKCNCDSRNYVFKLYRVIRQFVQNKIVKVNKKIVYAISISKLNELILKNTLGNNVKISRIYNPIELVQTKIDSIEINKNGYYLSVGRLSKEKGVEEFCKVITKLKLNGIVVGDGDEKEFLEKEYPEIKFVGWKTPIEVKKYMRNAKALVFTSLWYEGAPLTPLEAMTLGIPCFISNCCAGVEYVSNNNYIFSMNSNDLEEKIKKFEKIDNITDANINLEKYSINAYIQSIYVLYNKILNNEEKI